MIDPVALAVFLLLFGFVTVLGFFAPNWQRGDLDALHEWALAGRRFGTLITWFLIGGDLYTAYTFIALPALVFAVGAPAFFALPYTSIAYAIVFLYVPRFWTLAKRKHYITYADFARDRFDSKAIEAIVAVTGIIATILYIALQLVGLQAVIEALGLTGPGLIGDVPVIVAFAVLAVYTFRGGLRAPALVAIVKDALVYLTVVVALVVIPQRLGGYAAIFAGAAQALAHAAKPAGIALAPAAFPAYSTLALGSAFALFMYPHSITAALSAKSADVIRRNAALLPAYSLVLAVIALFGYMALAAGLHPLTPNGAVPALFKAFFPSWFVGVALAAVGIGALVPAAVMSIAAANLYTRNIHRELFKAPMSEREETSVAKTASLLVKAGALAAVLFLPAKFSIYYQFFAGALMLQTLPIVVLGLYTSWFHRRALVISWAVGTVASAYMIVSNGFASTYPLPILGHPLSLFVGIIALAINLVALVVLTPVLDAMGVPRGTDRTSPEDYVEAAA